MSFFRCVVTFESAPFKFQSSTGFTYISQRAGGKSIHRGLMTFRQYFAQRFTHTNVGKFLGPEISGAAEVAECIIQVRRTLEINRYGNGFARLQCRGQRDLDEFFRLLTQVLRTSILHLEDKVNEAKQTVEQVVDMLTLRKHFLICLGVPYVQPVSHAGEFLCFSLQGFAEFR